MYKPTLYLEGEDYQTLRSLIHDSSCPLEAPKDFRSILRHLTYLKTSSDPIKLLSPYSLLSKLLYSAPLTEEDHKQLREICTALDVAYPTHILLYVNQKSLGKPESSVAHESAFHPMYFPRFPTCYLFKVCCFPHDLPLSIHTIVRENILPAPYP